MRVQWTLLSTSLATKQSRSEAIVSVTAWVIWQNVGFIVWNPQIFRGRLYLDMVLWGFVPPTLGGTKKMPRHHVCKLALDEWRYRQMPRRPNFCPINPQGCRVFGNQGFHIASSSKDLLTQQGPKTAQLPLLRYVQEMGGRVQKDSPASFDLHLLSKLSHCVHINLTSQVCMTRHGFLGPNELLAVSVVDIKWWFGGIRLYRHLHFSK